ncbi:MAG TPA: hypothetical protein QF800_03165 [Phycisphaerales bacterium]|jgi:hypothetical protein|nr:hypothetical protein [Phycisphaerales bacterium]
MTWSNIEDTTGIESAEPSFDDVSPSPFTQERKRRGIVMATVIVGGAMIIFGMRFFVGGPTEVNAQVDAQQAIASFLAPDIEQEVGIPGSFMISMLTRNDAPTSHRALRSNPFILPGTLTGVSTNMSTTHRADVRKDRRGELQAMAAELTVSMVLRGSRTMAIIDGQTIRLSETLDLDDRTDMTLVGIDDSGIHIQLVDARTEITVDAVLPQP